MANIEKLFNSSSFNTKKESGTPIEPRADIIPPKKNVSKVSSGLIHDDEEEVFGDIKLQSQKTVTKGFSGLSSSIIEVLGGSADPENFEGGEEDSVLGHGNFEIESSSIDDTGDDLPPVEYEIKSTIAESSDVLKKAGLPVPELAEKPKTEEEDDLQSASSKEEKPESEEAKFLTKADKGKLGDLLVREGILTKAELDALLVEQKQTGKRLGELIKEKDIASDEKIAFALARQFGTDFISLSSVQPAIEALDLIPQAVAEKYSAVPIKVIEGRLWVAVSDPLNVVLQDQLEALTGKPVDFLVATYKDIRMNLTQFYRMRNSIQHASSDVEVLEDVDDQISDLDKTSDDDAPVIMFVNGLIEKAVHDGASDIHIEPYEDGCRVRYRIDGELYPSSPYGLDMHPAIVSRLKIMSRVNIAEKRKPQDGRIIIKVLGKRIDFRFSTLPTGCGEKIVMRVLDASNASVGMDKLGLTAKDIVKVRRFCETPVGMLLVTGPTGSGKTTTLYSIMEVVNKENVNIVTVEDPIEYNLKGVNQVQVNEPAGLTYPVILRSILRQDPDKVMVGEMRDNETASLGLRAALTGHFVYTTLHTNDAPSAVTRLIDMGIPSFLLSETLTGVIAQRLVRKLCNCKEKFDCKDKLAKILEIPIGTPLYRPKGCPDCKGYGYKGRKGIYEIMEMNPAIKELIAKEVDSSSIKKEAVAHGMFTLRKAGINLAIEGHTSPDEIMLTTVA